MSEDFEIGVTLAFRDGVSESIERTKRDMAQLSQVLSTGGISVQALRDRAIDFARVPEAGVQPSRAGSHRDKMAGGAETPSAGGNSTEARYQTGLPQSEVLRVVRPEVDRSIGQELVAAQRDLSGATVAPAIAADAPVQMPGQTNAAFLPHLAAPSPPADGRAAPVAPVTQDSAPVQLQQYQLTVARSLMPVPNGQQQYTSADPLAPVNTPLPWAAAGSQTVPAAPRRAESDYASTWNSVAAGELTRQQAVPKKARDTSGTVASPGLPWASASPPGLEKQRDSYSQTGASPPPAHSSGAVASEGDVYLDGQLMGRWISKYLAREAGRAPTGPTGFDARRGRLLPGATVGG